MSKLTELIEKKKERKQSMPTKGSYYSKKEDFEFDYEKCKKLLNCLTGNGNLGELYKIFIEDEKSSFLAFIALAILAKRFLSPSFEVVSS